MHYGFTCMKISNTVILKYDENMFVLKFVSSHVFALDYKTNFGNSQQQSYFQYFKYNYVVASCAIYIMREFGSI